MKQLFIGSDSFFLARQDHDLEKLFIEQTFNKDTDKKLYFLKEQDCYIAILKKNAQSSVKFTNFSKQDLSIKKYETIITTKTINFGTYTARAGVSVELNSSGYDSSNNQYYREFYWTPTGDKFLILLAANNENIKEIKEILNWPEADKSTALHKNIPIPCYAIRFNIYLYPNEDDRNNVIEPYGARAPMDGAIHWNSYHGGWKYKEVSRSGNYGKYQRLELENIPTPHYDFGLSVRICKGSFTNDGPFPVYNTEVDPETGIISGNGGTSVFSISYSGDSLSTVFSRRGPLAYSDFITLYNKKIGSAGVTSWSETIINNPDELTIYRYSPSITNISKTVSIQANLKYKIEPAINVVKEPISVPSEVFKIS